MVILYINGIYLSTQSNKNLPINYSAGLQYISDNPCNKNIPIICGITVYMFILVGAGSRKAQGRKGEQYMPPFEWVQTAAKFDAAAVICYIPNDVIKTDIVTVKPPLHIFAFSAKTSSLIYTLLIFGVCFEKYGGVFWNYWYFIVYFHCLVLCKLVFFEKSLAQVPIFRKKFRNILTG